VAAFISARSAFSAARSVFQLGLGFAEVGLRGQPRSVDAGQALDEGFGLLASEARSGEPLHEGEGVEVDHHGPLRPA
jgi:hypothetical protein